MMRYLVLLVPLLLCALPAAAQQTPKGFAACNANTISVSGTSSNIQLKNCGPSVILMNITSQEAFWTVGQASTTAATSGGSGTTSYSIPGNSFIMITVPDESAAGWYVAAITATSTTTIRVIEGRAQ